MVKKSNNFLLESDFNQKKVNHIVHYLDNFEVILKILKNGFAPSYCLEKISGFDYHIPMVSFCNIPLKDVDLYMRYGKYGIGMSLEWAVKNSISPVIYFHENTPFKDLHSKINEIHLFEITKNILNKEFDKIKNDDKSDSDHFDDFKIISEINHITIPTLQFFKNWKTKYKGKEIITYHEREWRYIPKIDNNRIVNNDEFEKLKKTIFNKKPHLPEYSLEINSIEDIRYVLIVNDIQRNKVLGVLQRKFGIDDVVNAIMTGKLMIINDELIRNDF